MPQYLDLKTVLIYRPHPVYIDPYLWPTCRQECRASLSWKLPLSMHLPALYLALAGRQVHWSIPVFLWIPVSPCSALLCIEYKLADSSCTLYKNITIEKWGLKMFRWEIFDLLFSWFLKHKANFGVACIKKFQVFVLFIILTFVRNFFELAHAEYALKILLWS